MDVYAQCLRSRGNVWSPHVLCTQPAFTQQFVLQVPLKSVQARQPSGLRREKLLKRSPAVVLRLVTHLQHRRLLGFTAHRLAFLTMPVPRSVLWGVFCVDDERRHIKSAKCEPIEASWYRKRDTFDSFHLRALHKPSKVEARRLLPSSLFARAPHAAGVLLAADPWPGQQW